MRLIVFLLLLIASPAAALNVAWTWSAPVEGLPAVFYRVQIQVDGGGWIDVATVDTTVAVLDMPPGVSVVRVAGIDLDGRQGDWSAESEPYSLVVHVSDGGPPGMLMAIPNPTNGMVVFPFRIARSGDVEILVYDARGMVVCRVMAAYLPAGTYVEGWDCRNNQGIPIPSGVYFARLRLNGHNMGRVVRFMVVK